MVWLGICLKPCLVVKALMLIPYIFLTSRCQVRLLCRTPNVDNKGIKVPLTALSTLMARVFVCVQAVGCDQILGSKASLDACGVCKGDNSTCKFFKGQYTLQHRANGELVFVFFVWFTSSLFSITHRTEIKWRTLRGKPGTTDYHRWFNMDFSFLLLCLVRVLLHGYSPSQGKKHSCSGNGNLNQLPGCSLPQEEVLPDRGLDCWLAGEVPLWWDRVWLPALFQQAGEPVCRWTY